MQPFDLLCIGLLLFQFFFLLRLVLHFIPLREDSGFVRLREVSFAVTEPVVAGVRRAVPPIQGGLGGFGIAEIVVILGIALLDLLICR